MLCGLLGEVRHLSLVVALCDVCVDDNVGQPLNEREKLFDLSVGHADRFVAKKFPRVLNA